ncbi:MAG: (Fe-S)-binding protein [Flavobacteriales bacterium]|nr:(Fe-S)-binding protein [Flavobacteriales bacterium]
MQYVPNIIFLLALVAAGGIFYRNASKIWRNIMLGRKIDRTDRPSDRLNTMLRVAFGQSKMVVRPVAGLLHIIVYGGFILINIEMLEIVVDGLLGTHRIFAPVLGGLYTVAIGFFEILGVLVIVACAIFLWRRNVIKLARFHRPEMKGWAFKDANNILMIEIMLMTALLVMNAVEANFPDEHRVAGPFVVSRFIAPLFAGMDYGTLHIIERVCWWAHIFGILAFLNYLPFSKHLHILLAFPNTYFANLEKKGRFTNLESVTNEVKLMMDPNADPYAAPVEGASEPQRFGVKDVHDMSRIQLLNAYTCTECGRCTSNCPANITGKKLSPRKIMMDTRDRMEEVGKNIDANGGRFVDDGRSLLHDFITSEELWACTSCNACVESCPVNIDPLSIIVDMRRYLVMEESQAPSELTTVFSNMENNGAPWQFSPADRANWVAED